MARKKMMYNKGGTKKKQMGGVQSPRSVDSFVEPPVEQPFADQSKWASKKEKKEGFKPSKKGKFFSEEKRTDRKADKTAIRTLKQTSRNTRRDKVNDAGEDIRMSRSDRRDDRKATNKASRIFRKQERKARNIVNKADRIEDRGERKTLKKTNKQKKVDAVNKKLNTLNQSESSSVKTTPVVKKDDTKKEVDKNKTTTTKNTESKSEKAKRTKSKSTVATPENTKGVLKPKIVYNNIMPKAENAKEGKYYVSPKNTGGGGGIKYQFKNGKYVPVNAEEKKKHDAATSKTKTITKSKPTYTQPVADVDNTGSVGFGFKKGGYRRRGGKR